MDPEMIEKYVERIYGYAIRRTFSREEADELSQEILYQVVRRLSSLRDESRFEPWLWGVAENVTRTFRRNMGKQRAMFCYDIPQELIAQELTQEEANEELYARVRSEIAMLSAIYRDILILYYYDGLSTKQIAQRLDLPEGTVTWRLSAARKKLKKEWNDMQESALRPKKLHIDIYGTGNFDGTRIPFPSSYINDALSQNILCQSYDEPRTVEELSRICGVPAYYIEDRIAHLIRHEAMVEDSRGKYRTAFLIWTDDYGKYCEEHAEEVMVPVADRILGALQKIAVEMRDVDFWRAEKGEDELFYRYACMAFDEVEKKYCHLTSTPISLKRDGFSWQYIGNAESGKYRRFGIPRQDCANGGSRGSYTHTVWHGFCGFGRRGMMYDYEINVCEDILTRGMTEDEDSAALAIRDGYIERREGGELFVTVPAMTLEQKACFDEIAERHLAPHMEAYSAAVDDFLIGYRKLFPTHVRETADRMCRSLFGNFLDVILGRAQREGKLARPAADSVCDVLLAFRQICGKDQKIT